MRYYAEITMKVFYKTDVDIDTEETNNIEEEICNELAAGIKSSALTGFEYIDILEVGKTIK